MQEGDLQKLEPMMIANLTRAIDFVKFGEAKNAALLTFASAWLLASANVAVGETARGCIEVRLALMIGVPLIALGALVALISFLPRTDLRLLSRSADPNRKKNYLFFGDLSELPASGLPGRLAQRYLSENGVGLNAAYYEDLGCQIVINAKVVNTKFKLFRFGVRSVGAGLVVYGSVAGYLAILRWLT